VPGVNTGQGVKTRVRVECLCDKLEHLDFPSKNIGLSDAITIWPIRRHNYLFLLARVPFGVVTWLLVCRGLNVGQDQTSRHSSHQRQ
jgi:hypothetical protein